MWPVADLFDRPVQKHVLACPLDQLMLLRTQLVPRYFCDPGCNPFDSVSLQLVIFVPIRRQRSSTCSSRRDATDVRKRGIFGRGEQIPVVNIKPGSPLPISRLLVGRGLMGDQIKAPGLGPISPLFDSELLAASGPPRPGAQIRLLLRRKGLASGQLL